MSSPFLPNAELVARAWLLAQDFTDGNVATTLPDVPWPNDEFIHLVDVGGTPDRDNPRFDSVVSLTIYAVKAGSTKPPWGKAQQLAQQVVLASYAQAGLFRPDPRVELVMPDNYGRALLGTVYPVSNVRKAPPDASQYAAYNLDMLFSWTPASVVLT